MIFRQSAHISTVHYLPVERLDTQFVLSLSFILSFYHENTVVLFRSPITVEGLDTQFENTVGANIKFLCPTESSSLVADAPPNG